MRVLMILSYLMLSGFVLYWLSSRYGQEKQSLWNELQREFVLSEQVMLDTLIIGTMINPALDGMQLSNRRNVSDTTTHEWAPKKKRIITQSFMIDSSFSAIGEKDIERMKMEMSDKVNDDAFVGGDDSLSVETRIHFHSADQGRDPDSILLQSVRLMVRKVKDSLYDGNKGLTFSFYSTLDTSLLKEDFSSRLDQRNLRYIWLGGTRTDATTTPGEAWVFMSNMLNDDFGVKIKNASIVLIQRLLPNIFFALVLLFLTAAAFILSFRGLKKQLVINAMREDMVANISHELRTPVSTLKVALEALQHLHMEKDSERIQEYLRLANLEMDRLEGLIQNVLLSSLNQEGRQMMRAERLDVRQHIRSVLGLMKMRFREIEAEVEYDLHSEPPLYILADALHFQGVLMNLLDNSLKYAMEKPYIRLKTSLEDGKVVISVADRGEGIPEAYLHDVFDKFFRVPKNNMHNVKGYGLGLSYAAMVMREHGGNIEVRNQEGGGCIFTLTFPAWHEEDSIH